MKMVQYKCILSKEFLENKGSFMGKFNHYFLDTYAVNPLLGMIPEEATQGGILSVIFTLAMLLPQI